MARTPDAIRTRSTVDYIELRNWLRLNTTKFDPHLQRCVAAAKAAAENYCNNPFLNADGTPGDIPADVEVWILQYASRKFNMPEGAVSYESQNGNGVVRRDFDYNTMILDLKPYRIVPKLATQGGGD